MATPPTDQSATPKETAKREGRAGAADAAHLRRTCRSRRGPAPIAQPLDAARDVSPSQRSRPRKAVFVGTRLSSSASSMRRTAAPCGGSPLCAPGHPARHGLVEGVQHHRSDVEERQPAPGVLLHDVRAAHDEDPVEGVIGEGSPAGESSTETAGHALNVLPQLDDQVGDRGPRCPARVRPGIELVAAVDGPHDALAVGELERQQVAGDRLDARGELARLGIETAEGISSSTLSRSTRRPAGARPRSAAAEVELAEPRGARRVRSASCRPRPRRGLRRSAAPRPGPMSQRCRSSTVS